MCKCVCLWGVCLWCVCVCVCVFVVYVCNNASPEQGQQEVCIEVTLVHFIHNDDVVSAQKGVAGHQTQQDTLCHEHHFAAP